LDPTKAVPEVILFFRTTFSIILALALAEAFKQSVNDKAVEQQHSVIFWDRMPALLSFLLLIVPFYQGMNRYFFITYADLGKIPQPYSIYLMIDGVALMAESALFFVMSRALALPQWRRFYWTVIALICVDLVWCIIGMSRDAPGTTKWFILDGASLIAFGIFMRGFHKTKEFRLPSRKGLCVMAIRATADYAWIWDFYFPVLPSPTAPISPFVAPG
jgi:hypothetical protein